MQALGSVGPIPHSAFCGQSPAPPTGQSRFVSAFSSSVSYYSEGRWRPYLSPPMSGSASPESRFEPFRGAKRRRQSHSPIDLPAARTAEPASAPGGYTVRSIKDVLNYDAGYLPVSHVGLSGVSGGPALSAAPGQRQTTVPTVSIRPQTAPLPPRVTRRTKAHVASACVNCKHKHLGCDSARPCRRCVIAGKEATCVDVTHKRRGRPPLKAEDGPLRGYESALRHQGVARGPLQTAHTSMGPRPSNSRQLRPVTDLSISGRLDPNDPYRKPEISPTFSINAVRSASMSSPGSTLPLTSPISATFPPSLQPFGEHSPARGNTYLYRPDSGLAGSSGRSLSDSSTILPRYGSERIATTSQQLQYPQRTTYQSSPPFSTADLQISPQPQPGHGTGLLPPPITVPSPTEFRLPPILPPLKNDGAPQQAASAPQKSSVPLWPQERHTRSESAGNIEGLRPRNMSQSYTQMNLPKPEHRKSVSGTELFTPLSSSPPRPPTRSSASFTALTSSSTEQSVHYVEKGREPEEDTVVRPAKRRKMELGEMVNE